MQLFYSPELNQNTTTYTFSSEESKHIVRVLRKKNGDTLHITNGMGFLFNAVIHSDNPKCCHVKVTKCTFQNRPNNLLHMVVAPTKMNERFEWFLEKATEIGVSEITPVICERSERKTIKTERFQRVVLAAMKQSLQVYLPKLNPLVSLKEFLQKEQEGHLYIAHCMEGEKENLKSKLQKQKNITVLIGPEGDFSIAEVQEALQQKYTPISLGKNRLRTETAAIVACITVANYYS